MPRNVAFYETSARKFCEANNLLSLWNISWNVFHKRLYEKVYDECMTLGGGVRFSSLHEKDHRQKMTISIINCYLYTRVYYNEIIILRLEQAMSCVKTMYHYVVSWRSLQEAK